ncbi:MAG: rRNA pseudouridine synthase, partial [Frankiales bacterium]|nr:rRNA pseudouridine synthase [Frankiales bacterium]
MTQPRSTPVDPDGIRLQKVMASAGVGSRRACEKMIEEGRVSVNDELVLEQGRRVDPEVDVIRVDTMRINTAAGQVYLAMNKPRGYVTAMTDPDGRPTVGDLVADRVERLFHVGRLDADTEGLLLLTNDGELAHRLSHPSYEVPKTY